MLTFVMLSVKTKPLVLSAIMLNVNMLSAIIMGVIMLNVIMLRATQAHLSWFGRLLIELACLLCFVKVPVTSTLVQMNCL